jgi:hypothetical protein
LYSCPGSRSPGALGIDDFGSLTGQIRAQSGNPPILDQTLEFADRSIDILARIDHPTIANENA